MKKTLVYRAFFMTWFNSRPPGVSVVYGSCKKNHSGVRAVVSFSAYEHLWTDQKYRICNSEWSQFRI